MLNDLHCHTRLSDGSTPLFDILYLAHISGLGRLAVTDHDTFAGIDQAAAEGKKYGLEVIPGAELSTTNYQTGRKVHILCYFPKDRAPVEEACAVTLRRRNEAGVEMVKRVKKYYPITMEQVEACAAQSEAIYKAHIMQAVADLGFTDSIYSDVYRRLFNREDGPCLVEYDYPDVYDMLRAVHEAKGIAVLAHPEVYDSIDILEELARRKLIDGVEAYYPRQTKQGQAKVLAIAEAYGLIATGGSDYHGFYHPKPHPLGSGSAPDESIARLYALAQTK